MDPIFQGLLPASLFAPPPQAWGGQWVNPSVDDTVAEMEGNDLARAMRSSPLSRAAQTSEGLARSMRRQSTSVPPTDIWKEGTSPLVNQETPFGSLDPYMGTGMADTTQNNAPAALSTPQASPSSVVPGTVTVSTMGMGDLSEPRKWGGVEGLPAGFPGAESLRGPNPLLQARGLEPRPKMFPASGPQGGQQGPAAAAAGGEGDTIEPDDPLAARAQALPPPSLAPSASLIDRLGSVIQNLGPAIRQGGLLGGLITAGQEGAAGRRLDPVGIQNQTERALAQRLPPDVAQMAASNPKVLDQLLPQIFGAKALQHVTIKDSLGNEIPLSYDPTSGRYFHASGRPYGSGGGGGEEGIAGLAHMPIEFDPKTGRDEKFASAFKAADPIGYSTVEAILRGDESAAGRNLQKYLPYAERLDPRFARGDYQTRLTARRELLTGATAKELTAYGTMARHAHAMHKLVDEIDPKGFTNFLPALTVPFRNGVLGQFSTDYQDKLGRLENLAGGLAAERAKALKGGNVAEGDVNEGRNILSVGKKSKAALHGAIDEMFSMVNARIAEKEDAYQRAMKGNNTITEFMSPTTAKLYRKYLGEAEEQAPAAVGPVPVRAPGPAPKAGNYVWDQKTNRLVPQ